LAIIPVSNATNVANVGVVKHGRKASSTRLSDPGRVVPEASAATLFTSS
jgi:hypothetical protein